MPTYEYKCIVCQHRFEARQSFDDPPLTHCPKCQGAAQRVIHPVGVVFKGSGWYSTDHRGSGGGSSNGSKSDDDPQTSSAGSTTEPAAASTTGGATESAKESVGESSGNP